MYDFTFPVYVSKMDKDLYRDQPFVTVVAAPRVMLLVYDGFQVQLNMIDRPNLDNRDFTQPRP